MFQQKWQIDYVFTPSWNVSAWVALSTPNILTCMLAVSPDISQAQRQHLQYIGLPVQQSQRPS